MQVTLLGLVCRTAAAKMRQLHRCCLPQPNHSAANLRSASPSCQQAFVNAICTQPVDQVAQEFAEMIAAGGAEAQAALGACHLSDRMCENGTQVSCKPVWSAFWRVPEVISPATIMRQANKVPVGCLCEVWGSFSSP